MKKKTFQNLPESLKFFLINFIRHKKDFLVHIDLFSTDFFLKIGPGWAQFG